MEYLNKIEVQGVVGNSSSGTIENTTYTQFSLCVQYIYQNGKDLVCGTTWIQVKYFGDIKINKGDWVYAAGKLKISRYSSPEGQTHIIPEIMASIVKVVKKVE